MKETQTRISAPRYDSFSNDLVFHVNSFGSPKNSGMRYLAGVSFFVLVFSLITLVNEFSDVQQSLLLPVLVFTAFTSFLLLLNSVGRLLGLWDRSTILKLSSDRIVRLESSWLSPRKKIPRLRLEASDIRSVYSRQCKLHNKSGDSYTYFEIFADLKTKKSDVMLLTHLSSEDEVNELLEVIESKFSLRFFSPQP